MRYPTSGYLQHLLAPETLIFFNYNNFFHIITSGIHFIERLKVEFRSQSGSERELSMNKLGKKLQN